MDAFYRNAAVASIDATYKLERFWLDVEYEQASDDTIRQEVKHKIELLNTKAHNQLKELGL